MKPNDSLKDWRMFSLSHPMGEGRGEGIFESWVVRPTIYQIC